MLPDIERLLVLQTRDQSIAEILSDLKRIPAEQELARTRLTQRQAAVQAAKLAVQENEMAIKTLELDSGTRKTTIGRLKTQQFETRKNEEFRALAKEIEKYQADLDALETQELELMEKGDILLATLNAAKAELSKAEAMVQEDLDDLAKRAESQKARLAEVEEERKEAEAKVSDPDLIETYDRLRKARGIKVVVNLSTVGQCEGCHVKVTPSTAIQVQGDKAIVQCENCGRILFAG